MDRRYWRPAREWRLPTPAQQGPDTIDTEEGLPIAVETSEHDLMTETL